MKPIYTPSSAVVYLIAGLIIIYLLTAIYLSVLVMSEPKKYTEELSKNYNRYSFFVHYSPDINTVVFPHNTDGVNDSGGVKNVQVMNIKLHKIKDENSYKSDDNWSTKFMGGTFTNFYLTIDGREINGKD